MLKKTIKFQDLEGNTLSEDFYFNLSKAELAEMEIVESKNGGMKALLEQIVREEDGKKVLELLKQIVKLSYGVRSDDNRRFIKTEEAWEDFKHTDAHSELLFEMYTNAHAASAFMKGISPVDIQEKALETEGLTPEEIREKAIEAMQGHKPKQD